MYPRSKFQEVLLEIRQEMAREADFDLDLFAEIVRTGSGPSEPKLHKLAERPEDEKAIGGSNRKPSKL